MASTRQLKSRIRSVKSTKQITKAMQMVAASRMRRTQDAAKSSAPYVTAANELMSYLASQGATAEHPLFAKRPVKSRLIIVVAGDKGLAGAFNGNVLKKYLDLLQRDDERGIKNHTITIGRKVSLFASRLKDTDILGSYDDMPDHPAGSTFHAILSTACDMYTRRDVDAVTIIYTKFVNSMIQEASQIRLLPAGYTETDVREFVRDATYEPGIPGVLDAVTYRLVGSHLYQCMLDSRASEHSMRMLAMKNATDNASDLIDDLTLEMNKERQSAITQELAEISGGAEAMK